MGNSPGADLSADVVPTEGWCTWKRYFGLGGYWSGFDYFRDYHF